MKIVKLLLDKGADLSRRNKVPCGMLALIQHDYWLNIWREMILAK